MGVLLNFISIASGILAIAAGLGLTVSNDIANILSTTGIPLSVIFAVSLLLALLSGGSARVYRTTVQKKQIQVGGKNNKQSMS